VESNNVSMPFACSEFFMQHLNSFSEPIKTQLLNIVKPLVNENYKIISGTYDPYDNVKYEVAGCDFLQHKYPNTLLLHIIDNCFSNCQCCFKVKEIRDRTKKEYTVKEVIEKTTEYIENNPQIDNILISGGDPFTLSNKNIINVCDKLLSLKNIRFVRIGTKGLIYQPVRFLRQELLNGLEGLIKKHIGKNIFIMLNIYHPNELSECSLTAIKELQRIGVQIKSQTTMLKGVNDDAEIIAQLLNKLTSLNVNPYYIFCYMPIKNREYFSIPLHRVFEIISQAKSKLNGIAKKVMLIYPHKLGKIEICGFLPDLKNPNQIVLKWHQVIPNISQKHEQVFILDYKNEFTIEI